MKYILIALAVYFCYRFLVPRKQGRKPYKESIFQKPANVIDDIMVKDPYCGVHFPLNSGVKAYDGQNELYFCSEDCKNKYFANKTKK